MDAIKEVLGLSVKVKGCFYHLTQSTFRKTQKLGLVRLYKDDEGFRHFCGMIDALAFLPRADVKAGMRYLHDISPEEGHSLLDYFDVTYVNGPFRPSRRNGLSLRLRRDKPMFPSKLWNVHKSTLKGEDRTNNQVEGWNNRFASIVGHDHPDIWVLILKMRMEVSVDETKLGKRRKRSVFVALLGRLQELCKQYRDGEKFLFVEM